MKLTKAILKRIKADQVLIAKLITASKKSYPTVMRWLVNNDEMLTTAACLTAICDHLNVTQEEALSKEKSV